MERAAECMARGYAKPRGRDFEAGWRAGVKWAQRNEIVIDEDELEASNRDPRVQKFLKEADDYIVSYDE